MEEPMMKNIKFDSSDLLDKLCVTQIKQIINDTKYKELENGISLIIMIGIVSRLPNVIVSEITLINEGVRSVLSELILLAIMFAVISLFDSITTNFLLCCFNT